MKNPPTIITLVFCLSFLIFQNSFAQSIQNISTIPCDYYGVEETAGTLTVGQQIIAYDPDGVQIGSFTVTQNGLYGFLSSLGDDVSTPEDEGAVEGDIITFYVDGIRQRKQAIWKSGDLAEVPLGIAQDSGYFNLHLDQMPAYVSYNDDPNYSGAAVADMILDFLDPDNTDTQQDLMTYGDTSVDGQLVMSELLRVLKNKAPSQYFFGSTITIDDYSDRGYLGPFDPTNQDDVLTQFVHWLSYRVPNTEDGKEYVPTAAATSADPATSADSDYQHWVSVVGVKTNQDPFPSLTENHAYSENYEIPDTLELFGVYLNDPDASGLGFHFYMAADDWKTKYFRPIASGLEGEGSYAVVMEPPSPDAISVNSRASLHNVSLKTTLLSPQRAISFYVPGWNNGRRRDYINKVLRSLNASEDFISLKEDEYFRSSFKDAKVRRCYKVDGGENDDYTIIPFDRRNGRHRVTTAAAIMNSGTGQFMLAYGDPEAEEFYQPMLWRQAYWVLRKEIGWQTKEYPINYWLSNKTGGPLYPGWSIITVSYDQPQNKSYIKVRTHEYSVTPDKDIEKENDSPDINVIYNRSYNFHRRSIKVVMFKVNSLEDYDVELMNKNRYKYSYLRKQGGRWLLVLINDGRSYGVVQIRNKTADGGIRDGGISYLYLR